VEDAVARAAVTVSRDLMVRAIVVFSRTGHSASIVAAWRPQAPILAASAREATCRRLMLSWGTIPSFQEEISPSEFSMAARRIAKESGLASDGDYILQVSGFNPDPGKNEPAVTVLRI
jgi:pyruvate kinase